MAIAFALICFAHNRLFPKHISCLNRDILQVFLFWGWCQNGGDISVDLILHCENCNCWNRIFMLSVFLCLSLWRERDASWSPSFFIQCARHWMKSMKEVQCQLLSSEREAENYNRFLAIYCVTEISFGLRALPYTVTTAAPSIMIYWCRAQHLVYFDCNH